MHPTVRAILAGLTAIVALLALYFGLLTLASDWQFTLEQFAEFWPYILMLAGGFGVLNFAPINPQPVAIELQIQRPGEPAPRRFRWLLK